MQYVIVSFLEQDFPTEFSSKRWPLHITLLQPFSTELELSTVESLLDTACLGNLPVETRVTQRAMFGHREDRPVSLVDYTPKLEMLHTDIVNAFRDQIQILGVAFPKFTPHITDNGAHYMEVDTVIHLTSVSIVTRAGPKRAVAHTVQNI